MSGEKRGLGRRIDDIDGGQERVSFSSGEQSPEARPNPRAGSEVMNIGYGASSPGRADAAAFSRCSGRRALLTEGASLRSDTFRVVAHEAQLHRTVAATWLCFRFRGQ
jgi:hypothetical protein